MEAFSSQKVSLLDSLSRLSLKLLFPFALPCVSALCVFYACRWAILNDETFPHLSVVRTGRIKCNGEIRPLFQFFGFETPPAYLE